MVKIGSLVEISNVGGYFNKKNDGIQIIQGLKKNTVTGKVNNELARKFCKQFLWLINFRIKLFNLTYILLITKQICQINCIINHLIKYCSLFAQNSFSQSWANLGNRK